MKSKSLLGGIFLILALLAVAASSQYTVYICKGPYSKKYHLSSECRGLRNCSTDIYELDLKEAKELGRTLCGWED